MKSLCVEGSMRIGRVTSLVSLISKFLVSLCFRISVWFSSVISWGVAARARERERGREKGDLRCRWWSPADPSLLLPSLIAAAFFAFFWDSVLRAAIWRARSSHGVRQNKITGNKDSQIWSYVSISSTSVCQYCLLNAALMGERERIKIQEQQNLELEIWSRIFCCCWGRNCT
jgi:hypothetical protein